MQDAGADIVFVYGDPAYYSRFGFRTDLAEPFSPPYELTHPSGWHALVLNGRNNHFEPAPITCVAALNYHGTLVTAPLL